MLHHTAENISSLLLFNFSGASLFEIITHVIKILTGRMSTRRCCSIVEPMPVINILGGREENRNDPGTELQKRTFIKEGTVVEILQNAASEIYSLAHTYKIEKDVPAFYYWEVIHGLFRSFWKEFMS